MRAYVSGPDSWRLNSEVHHEVATTCVADRVTCVSGEPAGARHYGSAAWWEHAAMTADSTAEAETATVAAKK